MWDFLGLKFELRNPDSLNMSSMSWTLTWFEAIAILSSLCYHSVFRSSVPTMSRRNGLNTNCNKLFHWIFSILQGEIKKIFFKLNYHIHKKIQNSITSYSFSSYFVHHTTTQDSLLYKVTVSITHATSYFVPVHKICF